MTRRGLREHPTLVTPEGPVATVRPSTPVVATRAPTRTGAARLAATLFVVDGIAVASAILLATTLLGVPAAPAAVSGAVALALIGSRRVPITLRVHDQLGHLALCAAVPSALLAPWLGGRAVAVLSALVVGAVAVARALAHAVVRSARRRGRLLEPTLIVGADETGRLLAHVLVEHPELGLVPLGFLDAAPPPEPSLPVLGPASRLVDVVAATGTRRVLVSAPIEPDVDLAATLRAVRATGADVCVVPRFREIGTRLAPSSLDEAFGIPLVPLRPQPGPATAVVKRAFDLSVATVLAILVAPLVVVLVVAVRLRLGRAPLFRQRRVTRPGHVAEIYKLRTLPPQAAPDTAWAVTEEGTTGLGRWLRRSHLDELAQLANVLRGDMSLVGPRPERPYFVDAFSATIPGYEERLQIPSGITGLAQVNGLTGDTSLRERVRFDTRYAETWSPWLDVVIVLRTLARGVVRAGGLGR